VVDGWSSLVSDGQSLKPRTLAAQALRRMEETTGGVVPPIHVATTYQRDEDNAYSKGYTYARPDNATVRHAEAVIAALEGAAGALLFASGMAAISAVFVGLPKGARVVASTVMYTGSRNFLDQEGPRLGLEVERVDTSELEALERAASAAPTTLVYVETPGNPLWTIVDIAAAARIARRAGALLVVDSTCATPILTRPLALGADIVVHAATKYLNGHSDVVAGALAFAREDDTMARIARVRQIFGGILSPFDAHQLTRGMRTLPLRVEAQSRTAMDLARRLTGHPLVARVYYPGLPDHPGHEVAARQMTGGFGGMMSLGVRGGERAAIATAAAVRVWTRATSLGGVESLIEHRASMEGEGTPCPPNVLRLSVGLEDPDDLYDDLDAALRAGASA
jgi:cystathionine gamma-synthase